jgi:hypothetical protein
MEASEGYGTQVLVPIHGNKVRFADPGTAF